MAPDDEQSTKTDSFKQHADASDHEASPAANDAQHEFGQNPGSAPGSPAEAGVSRQGEKNADDAPQGPVERSRGRVALIMLSLGIAVFLAAIDVTIITTALPSISEYFGSASGYTWVGSAYLLGNAASVPLWGKFSDIFGRKPVLLVANGVFFVGSLLAAVSVSIGMLIVSRAIQGIGGGGLIVLVNICIGDLFSMRRRGAYYGIIGGVWAIASALGPILGGTFAEYVTWRWCFYINLPFDGVAFVIIWIFLDLHTPRTPFWEGIKHIDWLGALLIIGGTVMFLLGLEFGGATFPWDSATTLCLMIFGVLLVVLFFINEWKLAAYPIVPIHIFKQSSNLACLGVCLFHGFVFVASSYFLPLYFQVVRGASPLLSGVYYLPSVVALSIASIAGGITIRKTGQYLPIIWVSFAFMTLGTGLFINLKLDSSWAKIICYQGLAGLGIGPNFQAPLIALQSGVSPRDIASATATFGFTRNIATAISVVIGTVVFQNVMEQHFDALRNAIGPESARQLSGARAIANVGVANSLPEPGRSIARSLFADSLSDLWIMFAVFSGAGLIVSFFIRKRKLNKEHEELKQGLEAEAERKKIADDEKRAKKEAKARRKGVVEEKV